MSIDMSVVFMLLFVVVVVDSVPIDLMYNNDWQTNNRIVDYPPGHPSFTYSLDGQQQHSASSLIWPIVPINFQPTSMMLNNNRFAYDPYQQSQYSNYYDDQSINYGGGGAFAPYGSTSPTDYSNNRIINPLSYHNTNNFHRNQQPDTYNNNNLIDNNDGWSNWTMWSACSSTGGLQTRTRYCTNTVGMMNGSSCRGRSVDYRSCTGASTSFDYTDPILSIAQRYPLIYY